MGGKKGRDWRGEEGGRSSAVGWGGDGGGSMASPEPATGEHVGSGRDGGSYKGMVEKELGGGGTALRDAELESRVGNLHAR